MTEQEFNHESLDAFLDGTMPEEQRKAFAQRLEGDPACRAEIERQGHIDHSLGRLFPGEGADRALERLLRTLNDGAVAPKLRVPSQKKWVWIAAAAAIGLAAVVGWQLVFVSAPRSRVMVAQRKPGYALRKPWKNMQTVYKETVAAGFKPEWVCKDDRETVQRLKDHFGQGLLAANIPRDVSIIGWSYCNTITPDTAAMLVRSTGGNTIVFVDHADRDGEYSMPAETRLHLFRRVVGGLVCYEVSPAERPAIVNDLYDPADPFRTLPSELY